MTVLKNLTGKTFNYLTIVSRCLEKTDNTGHSFWNCRCLCGKMIIAESFNIRCGHTKSCGCRPHSPRKTKEYIGHKKDITGQRFGKLIVLYPSTKEEKIEYNKKSEVHAYWTCICDCGKISVTSQSNLSRGHTQSCGCLIKESGQKRKGKNNYAWRGGISHTSGGYIKTMCEKDHPMADSHGYILQHRLVMSEFLGRPLTDKESIHHKNGIKDDNRIENLELRSRYHGYGQSLEDMTTFCIEFLKKNAPHNLKYVIMDSLIKFDDLSPEHLEYLKSSPPQTREELNAWLKVFLNVYLADVSVEEGNSTPLDMVWNLYKFAVLGDASDKNVFIGMASRGSMKTLSAAVFEFLCLLFDPKRDYIHLGAIQRQSDFCYKYVRGYSESATFANKIEYTKMSETKSFSGKTLEITVGTMNSCNALHGSIVMDEVDLMPRKIFIEALGMKTSTKMARGIQVYISSRKVAFGNIADLLERSSKPGSRIQVYKWGILEMCETCPDTRSGTAIQNYYINEDDLVSLTEDEYNKEYAKDKYVKTLGFDGCAKCGFFSVCKGNLKKHKTPNPYHLPIDDAVGSFKEEDTEFFKSQRLNRKPSKIGLVFPSYDEGRHLKTYGEMWEIFKGEKHPDVIAGRVNDIGVNDLIGEFIKCGCRLCLGVDFGFTSPFVALLVAIDGADRSYVLDNIETTGRSDLECVTMCYQRWGSLPLTVYPDIENPSGIKEFKNIVNLHQLNWHILSSVVKDIDLGIGIVRNFLRTPGTTQTRIHISHNVGILKAELKIYHYDIRKSDGEVLERPSDSDNHSIDALRYVLATLFTRNGVSLGSAVMDKTIEKQELAKQQENPSIEQVAAKIGLTLSPLNEEDVKEMQKDEKKDGSKGGGGSSFNWSF